MINSVWPYEEIAVRPGKNGCYQLATPWFAREIQVKPEFQEQFSTFFERPTELSMQDRVMMWSNVFSSNLGDPLFYFLPRSFEKTEAIDVHRPANGIADAKALETRFFAANPDLSSQVRTKIEFRDWDQEGLLSLSQIAETDLYDPRALFSALRRFYYLDSVEFDQTIQMYNDVRALQAESQEKFRQAAAIIARQNFEVTRRCQEVLSPALTLAQSARSELQDFIQSEKGHDNLLRRGLLELGMDPLETSSLPVTNYLLDFFKLTASQNFLAFAYTVSLFEETSNDGGVDPLTKLLLENGEEKAAQPFLRHSEINDGGHHEQIGLDLIARMGPIGREYALETIQLCEQVSKIVNVYTMQIREQIQAETGAMTPQRTLQGPAVFDPTVAK